VATAFEVERAIEVVRAASRASGRFNNLDRRAWWHDRGVDATLQQYGNRQRTYGDPPRFPLYFPQAACMAPVAPSLQSPPARTTASGRSRTGSSAAGDHTRSAAPALSSGGVVIRDGVRHTRPR
jgi:hypothetical protein